MAHLNIPDVQLGPGGGKMSARHDLDALKAALNDRAEELAEELLGPPNKGTRRSQEWRWNRKGSAALVVRGHKRGAFRSHEAVTGGSLLDLIMHARGCSLPDAVDWAAGWLGWGDPEDQPVASDEDIAARAAERARQQAERDAAQVADETARQDKAQALWAASTSVAGTLGEKYLTAARRIPAPAMGWPESVRYRPYDNSLIFAATDAEGVVRATQRVFLTAGAQKVDGKPKLTNGVTAGAVVRLPGPADGPLLLAEGPETGLSVWAATGNETWIALGQLSKIEPPAGRKVVLCRDDDKKSQLGAECPEKRHRKLVRRLRRSGMHVITVTPWVVRRYDGSDFNDVIKQGGVAAVLERISQAIQPDLACEYSMPTLTLEQAKQELAGRLREFSVAALDSNARLEELRAKQAKARRDLKRLTRQIGADKPKFEQITRRANLEWLIREELDTPAPHYGVRVGLGIGKTFGAAAEVAHYIAEAEARKLPSAVLWTAPTLELADQTAAMLRDHGIKVGVYRGRRAPNPESEVKPSGHEDDTGRMCLDLPAVRAALDAKTNVATDVCGADTGDGPACPFRAMCPYQINLEQLTHVDVIVAAHNALLQTLPSRIESRIGLTVIDESFWQLGCETAHLDVATLVQDVKDAPVLDSETEQPDGFVSARLLATMDAVKTALEAHADGTPIETRILLNCGIDAARLREASREQQRRMKQVDVYPGMPLAERVAAARQAPTNGRIPATAALLRCLADLLDGKDGSTGRVELETAQLKAGPLRRVLVHQLRKLSKTRTDRPMLYLDATMPLRAARQYLPNLVVTADVDAVAPYMTVIQVLSARDNYGGWGKSSVLPSEGELEPDENARRHARIDNMRDAFGLLRRDCGDGLVVTYKKLEPSFGGMPGIETAHFNALAGLNDHETVSWAAVIGRPMPNPAAAATLAKQLFGDWAEPGEPVRVYAGMLMADGSRRSIRTSRFDDPNMEAVRKAIADDNVVQGVGRPRGVRRTEANPVLMIIMSDVVTPFPVSAVTDWPTLALTGRERMAARGVVLDSSTDAHRAYPDLFPSPRSADDGINRQNDRSSTLSPIIYSLLGINVDDTPKLAVYRPAPSAADPQPQDPHRRSP